VHAVKLRACCESRGVHVGREGTVPAARCSCACRDDTLLDDAAACAHALSISTGVTSCDTPLWGGRDLKHFRGAPCFSRQIECTRPSSEILDAADSLLGELRSASARPALPGEAQAPMPRAPARRTASCLRRCGPPRTAQLCELARGTARQSAATPCCLPLSLLRSANLTARTLLACHHSASTALLSPGRCIVWRYPVP